MKTAFLFPGQGSQYVGMGTALKAAHPVAAEVFEEADDALGFGLSDLILNGPLETLTQTENNQPAILTTSVAYLRVLEANGFTPDITAGHSLGEYSALVAAGALSFVDAIRLVRLRGRCMQAAVPLGEGTMSAILRLDDEIVERLCAETLGLGVVEPAGYNAVGQVAIAGAVAAVAAVEAKVEEAGGVAKRLNVSAPFHCSMLSKAGEELAAALTEVTFKPLAIPYVANVDAEIITDSDRIASRLVDQVMKPVRWVQTIKQIIGFGTERYLEVGPGRTLFGLQRRIDRKAKVVCVDKEGVLDALLNEEAQGAQ